MKEKKEKKTFIECNNNIFSRQLTLLTRIATLRVDRLTFVLIRINIANVCVCLLKRIEGNLGEVYASLFNDCFLMREKKKKRAVAGQQFI